jgi:predicted O-methyltransferase YrrM
MHDPSPVRRLLRRINRMLGRGRPPWPPEWAVPVIHELEDRGILWALRDVDLADVGPFLRWAPPGHFYSPVPSLSEAARLTAVDPRTARVAGVDVGLDRQRSWLRALAAHADYDPPATATEGWRYHRDNDQYGIGDATVLQAMLRHLGTRRVVEIGSGFSSAVMLDTADRHLPDLELTFVEPYPERLNALLSEADRDRVVVHELPVQEVPPAIVDDLEAGDVLFIDSSHVVRPGSDVCHEIFELLPRLRPGVLVHVHDICYPLEIPTPWITEGRGWTEVYLLRAFLQHNEAFEIVLFHSCLAMLDNEALVAALPQCAPNAGLSIWLRRR